MRTWDFLLEDDVRDTQRVNRREVIGGIAALAVYIIGGCADKNPDDNNDSASNPNVIRVISGATVLGVTQQETASIDQRPVSLGVQVFMLNGVRASYNYKLDGIWQVQGSADLVIPLGRHSIDWYTVDPADPTGREITSVLHIEVHVQ